MDPVTAPTELAERRAVARPEGRAGEAGAPVAEAGGRALSDLRRLADGLLRMLESDRAHVSRLLGDDVVSVMTMARYLIEDAVQRLSRGEVEETSEALQNASARIRDATGQIVQLCSQLRPKVLDDLGLLPALTWYFREFSHQNRGIFVSPRITAVESDVPVDLKLAAFRIVQAALSNVAKHSKASTVRVFLSQFENELRLVIEDNGVGFDVERWRNRRHVHEGCGLAMILRWVEASGGKCHIGAIPRHGTRIQMLWRLYEFAHSSGSVQSGDPGLQPARAGGD
jgi:two-component system NarL family sensor kinase